MLISPAICLPNFWPISSTISIHSKSSLLTAVMISSNVGGFSIVRFDSMELSGYGAGQKAGRRSGVFPLPQHAAPAACAERAGGRGKPAHAHGAALPAHGLRAEMERAGAFVGLPLPRLALHAGGRPHRKSRDAGP